MFVFLVVVPKRKTNSNAPKSFVIVNNNDHQLPLGTMFFDSVDQRAMKFSNRIKEKLDKWSNDAEERLLQREETTMKAVIEQELMRNNIEKASELYLENKSIFTELSLKDIAWYVHPLLKNDNRIETFFPDLPPPIKSAEVKDTNMVSVETCKQMESRSKRNLERTHTVFTKAQQEEKKKKAEGIFTYAAALNEAEEDDDRDDNESSLEKKSIVKARTILESIMDNMTNNRMDVAAELYLDKGSILDGFYKREIAICVHRHMDDKEMIPILFPDLPDPNAPVR